MSRRTDPVYDRWQAKCADAARIAKLTAALREIKAGPQSFLDDTEDWNCERLLAWGAQIAKTALETP